LLLKRTLGHPNLRTTDVTEKTPKFIAEKNRQHQRAAGLTADVAPDQQNQRRVHGARAPPVRLLDKRDVLAITNVTYVTLWSWMRDSKFPRGRIVGGKSMWLSTEIDEWLANLPRRPLKGDSDKEAE
jgi:predicted DNA-binding transcriptional regulator AlpA